MTDKDEALSLEQTLRLALEALETSMYPQQKQLQAITAIQAALKAKDEPVAWRDAAIRLGEELSSVGPNGYYDMDAKEWLDWTMEQNPRGKHSLPQRTWVGLTDEECLEASLTAAQTLVTPITLSGVQIHVARVIEAKLKEKNGYA
jgi:hypothetical protein